jgi:hypothetical protein
MCTYSLLLFTLFIYAMLLLTRSFTCALVPFGFIYCYVCSTARCPSCTCRTSCSHSEHSWGEIGLSMGCIPPKTQEGYYPYNTVPQLCVRQRSGRAIKHNVDLKYWTCEHFLEMGAPFELSDPRYFWKVTQVRGPHSVWGSSWLRKSTGFPTACVHD